MSKIYLALSLLCGLVSASCNHHSALPIDPNTEVCVKIETTMGDITVKLYNDTPMHRDNFIKLVKKGTYKNTLFHRVVKDFMIQAGDPTSKKASLDTKVGSGGVGYYVPAEINSPMRFHKKGALCAARQADGVNPKKESSGCQFYIVTGTVYNDSTLMELENNMRGYQYDRIFHSLLQSHNEEISMLQKIRSRERLNQLRIDLAKQAKELSDKLPHFAFTPEQWEAYTTIGGTPLLDGEYTVFGEVVDGLDVVDEIGQVPVNRADRPLEDVRIIKTSILQPCSNED